jgi:hypothetical protein
LRLKWLSSRLRLRLRRRLRSSPQPAPMTPVGRVCRGVMLRSTLTLRVCRSEVCKAGIFHCKTSI